MCFGRPKYFFKTPRAGFSITQNFNPPFVFASSIILRHSLTKKIPSGAGIGGGSGDAATTLLLLNQYFELKLDQEELIHIAKKLGSDVPLFIINQPCYATGVGEILTPISLDLSQYRIEMIFSDIQVSTPLAYSWIKPQKPQKRCLS